MTGKEATIVEPASQGCLVDIANPVWRGMIVLIGQPCDQAQTNATCLDETILP